MVYIYTLSDPITNEIKYCGKTKNIKERLIGHLKEKKSNQDKISWIKKIKFNGLKPILEIIDEVDENNWDFWEKFWIAQLKCWGFELFNKTDGGEYSVTGFKHTDEVKRKISDSQIGKKLSKEWRENISKGRKGIKFSDKHIKNLSISHKGQLPSNNKAIFQIDVKNGEILNRFNSITDAYKHLGIDPKSSSSISTACKGKIRITYNYYWCYSKDYDNFVFKEYHRIYNPILQFDNKGNLIKEYSNIVEAAKENKLKQSSISHALNEEPSCGGFIWFHKDKFDKNILNEKLSKIKRNYILYQIDIKTNQILQTFNSIKEAEEKTRIKHISCVLSGRRNHAGGFLWKRKSL
jgi:group I intron endonuclease